MGNVMGMERGAESFQAQGGHKAKLHKATCHGPPTKIQIRLSLGSDGTLTCSFGGWGHMTASGRFHATGIDSFLSGRLFYLCGSV